MNNVLLVGFGNIGKIHFRILQNNKKINKIFVVDKEHKKNNINLEILRTFDNTFLVENKIKFAIIATPSKSHFEIAERLIKAKIPILIEKPMVLDLIHLKKLKKISKKENIFVMVGFSERFNNTISKLKHLTNGHEIVSFFSIRNSLKPDSKRVLDNCDLDTLIHDLDLLNFFVPGLDFKSFKISKSENFATATYSSANFSSNLTSNRFSQFKQRKIVITTNKAEFHADLINFEIKKFLNLNTKLKDSGFPYFETVEEIINIEKNESIRSEHQFLINNFKNGFDQELFDSYFLSHQVLLT